MDAENGLKANFVGTKSKVFNNKTRDNWLSEGGNIAENIYGGSRVNVFVNLKIPHLLSETLQNRF